MAIAIGRFATALGVASIFAGYDADGRLPKTQIEGATGPRKSSQNSTFPDIRAQKNKKS
jgi:hypothetical protein